MNGKEMKLSPLPDEASGLLSRLIVPQIKGRITLAIFPEIH